jgi:peptidoglycan/xylan/chitin deacetylase (PgdA/CDA1 family)
MFLFRVDIDSVSGLLRGVPRILSILDRLDMEGTFYSIMGWEGDLISSLRHRFLRSRRGIPGGASGASWGMGPVRLLEHSRCLLYPVKIPALGSGLLTEIRGGGHCLGVHGYVHVRWHSPSPRELEEEFEKMTLAFRDLTGESPRAIATPLGHDGPGVRKLVARHNFKTLTGLGGDPELVDTGDGSLPFVYIPVNVDSIEFLRTSGISRKGTYERITRKILEAERAHGLASLYVHPRYEGSHEIELLEKVLSFVRDEGIETGTHLQFADAFKNGGAG